jgi:nitrogen regulatory protein P-II 2
MKVIMAMIQPFMLNKVTSELEAIEDFPGMTVSDVRGLGRRRGLRERRALRIDEIKGKVFIEIVTPDEKARRIVETLVSAARTRSSGEGKVREGQLLTIVATVEALAVALTLITAFDRAGMRRGKLLLIAATLATMIIAGATAGVKFMWGRSGADLDLIFAICLAAPLLRAMESLV